MKRIVVNVAGATNQFRDLTIEPATTTADVLKELGIESYLLKRYGSDEVFGPDEDLYAAVSDGAKLSAAPAMSLGGVVISNTH